MRVFLIISFLCIYSCTSITCGELSGEWKMKYERARSFSNDFTIENIPCDFYYINVVVNSPFVDTAAIHSLHNYLYDENLKVGWQVLLVYDADRNYLFSHKYNGTIYIQKGD